MNTPREDFLQALTPGHPAERPPHFELVFFLTMEAFGRVHPSHRNYEQWDQMSKAEQALHRNDIADLHLKIAERYEYSGMLIHPNPMTLEEDIRTVDAIRNQSGDTYFLMLHGDATFAIPSGEDMEEFAYRLADEPEKLKAEARSNVQRALERAEKISNKTHLDGFALCSDYCFNSGPFLSPNQFSEFVAPYLEMLIQGYHDLGFKAIKHTDGNINPILDQLMQCKPDALHSLDPQGGMDIAEVKKQYGEQICLIGNVNCAQMHTGTVEEMEASVQYALTHGSPGGGYIFSTSNCIYTGMPLERYEHMHRLWKAFSTRCESKP